jgi:hypothetical protein
MSAFQELTESGVVGPETVDLLIRLVGQTGRTQSFPPPLGHGSWSDQAVLDYVGSILASARGSGMAVGCVVSATDDRSLERLLLTSIRRFMIDEAKATPIGKLRLRLRGLLGKDERFVSATRLLAGEEAWTIPANGSTVWSEDIADLERVTASVQVTPIHHLNRAGPTPGPVRESLLTMSHEALMRAAGAMRAQLLARFLYRRFNLDAAEPTSPGSASSPRPMLSLDPTDEVSVLARTIYDDLSVADIRILSNAGTAADLSKSDPARDALFERLRIYAGSDVGRDAVSLAARWCSPSGVVAS